jgi:hypothetical protein
LLRRLEKRARTGPRAPPIGTQSRSRRRARARRRWNGSGRRRGNGRRRRRRNGRRRRRGNGNGHRSNSGRGRRKCERRRNVRRCRFGRERKRRRTIAHGDRRRGRRRRRRVGGETVDRDRDRGHPGRRPTAHLRIERRRLRVDRRSCAHCAVRSRAARRERRRDGLLHRPARAQPRAFGLRRRGLTFVRLRSRHRAVLPRALGPTRCSDLPMYRETKRAHGHRASAPSIGITFRPRAHPRVRMSFLVRDAPGASAERRSESATKRCIPLSLRVRHDRRSRARRASERWRNAQASMWHTFCLVRPPCIVRFAPVADLRSSPWSAASNSSFRAR